MKHRTIFTPAARDELRKVDRHAALKILAKITELEGDPTGYGTTELVGQPGTRRLRVGNYRVLFTIDNGELIIWVVAVDHRSEVYKHLS